ncbi:MAG: GGDEF domain-containing protein, partial [Vicinamibacterales bacterium]|nr:GGDEF domain-containing protein [Vicinamibacterales bacterium]
ETGALFPVLSNQLALSLCPVRERPDLVLVGTGVGLFRLRFDGAHWRNLGPVPGFAQPVYGLSEHADGSFWLYTQTGDGVIRLTLSDGADTVRAVRRYTSRDGLPSDAGNSVVPGRDGALFGTSRGIYRYNPRDDRFEPDRRFSDTSGGEGQVRLLHEDRSGNVFVLAGDRARFYRKHPDGTYRGSYPFLARLRNFRVSDFVGALDDSSLLLGHRDGFIHVDLAWTPATEAEIAPLVRRVVTPAGVAFSGTAPAEEPALTTLPFKFNSARFWFAAPFLEGAAQTEFSYRFDGFDDEWSPWQRQNTSAYTNLREGRYDFRVRARNAYGDVSREAAYRISVQPPWYRTGFAFLVFAVVALLVVYGTAQLNSRHLRREKARLESLVAEKTRELLEASLSDELTGLRNRRFVTEVVLTEFHAFASFKQSLLTRDSRSQPERASTVFACFLCDIDHFKRVNDEYGHDAGDLVLRQVARLLKASAREDDYAIRWGGEEFLVILKHTNPAYVPVFAEKVRKAVADARFRRPDGAADPLRLTVSIGYSMFPFYDEAPRLLTFEHMVQLADLAMYYAKDHGRNRTAGSLPGTVRMREDDIERSLADLDAAIAAAHVVISSPATGPQPTDGRVPGLLASVHAPS